MGRDIAYGTQGFRWNKDNFNELILASPCEASARAELEKEIMQFARNGDFSVGIQRQVHANLVCAMRTATGAAPKTTEFYAFVIFSQLCDSLDIYCFGPYKTPGGNLTYNYAD